MNGFQTLALALKRQKSNIGNLAMIILLIFLFFMGELVAVTLLCPHLEKWIVEKKMGQELSQWGMLTYTVKNDWDEEWEAQAGRFHQELLNEHIVEQIGSFGMWEMQDEALGEVIAIQDATDAKNSVIGVEDALYGYYTCDRSLFDDGWLEDEKLKSIIMQNDILLLLGSAYGSIEDGTIYESALDEKRRYIVAGHFPAGYLFFTGFLKNDIGFSAVEDMIDMDGMTVMILPEQDIISATNYFFNSSGVTEELMEKIRNKADTYGLDVSLIDLETRFAKRIDAIREENTYLLPFFLFMFAAALTMFVSGYLVDFMLDRRKYGIYYTVGATDKDIAGIHFWEGMIRTVPAMAAAGIIFFLFYQWLYGKYATIAFAHAVFLSAFSAMLVTIGILLLSGTLITHVLLKEKSVNKLLGASKF